VSVIENTAPVAVSDSASTNDRTAITIDALANDTDVDSDEITLTHAIAEQGSIVLSNNSLIYTPLAGFEGTDIIIYDIDDNNGGKGQGQVVITINANETVNITTKSSDSGSFGIWHLLIVSMIFFIRRWHYGADAKRSQRLSRLLTLLRYSGSSFTQGDF
jgi:large repetitive protein